MWKRVLKGKQSVSEADETITQTTDKLGKLSVNSEVKKTPRNNEKEIKFSDLTLKHTLGKPKEFFLVIQNLGTGTFGRVLLVEYSASKTYYALKVLKKSEIIRLKQVEHVNQERAITKDLHHNNIVKMLFCNNFC